MGWCLIRIWYVFYPCYAACFIVLCYSGNRSLLQHFVITYLLVSNMHVWNNLPLIFRVVSLYAVALIQCHSWTDCASTTHIRLIERAALWYITARGNGGWQHPTLLEISINMMTSWNGNIFHVIGNLRGEFNGHRWIPHTKASDAELWRFLWSSPEWTVE